MSYSKKTIGGLCQTEDDAEITRLCDGISSLFPDAASMIKRRVFDGYGIVFNDGSEIIMKRERRKWAPLLHVPKDGISESEPSDDVMTVLKDNYGNKAEEFFSYANGDLELPTISFTDDEFGASLRKISEDNLVTLKPCHGSDNCVSMTEKGFIPYFAFFRFRPNDGISRELKNITRKGGASMEFEGLLTGVEKTSTGSRKIYLGGDAVGRAKANIASRAGRRNAASNFNVESTGRLELKNVIDWRGRTIERMIDEIAEYEQAVASLGLTRPKYSNIQTTGVPKISGGIHITFTVPVTKFDTEHKEMWDLFMANWLRMVQWWEPLILGVSGSPGKNQNPPPDWFHSVRHHVSWSVKAGAAKIDRLVPDDGAVTVFGGPRTDWIRKSEQHGGRQYQAGERSDLRISSNRGLVAWTGADRDECRRKFPSGRCTHQTDAAAELRFFEYEPLHYLEERAEVIPLIMDRAYQLAAQDIEIPNSRGKRTYNDAMWKVMEKGWEGTLTRNEAKEFSKIFSKNANLINEGDTIENAGKKIVDELWKNHYDDYFSSYFGVKNKPYHVNYMKISKEGIKEHRRTGVKYIRVTDRKYGQG